MKKFLLTLIAILMMASVYANNAIIDNKSDEIDINKAVLPEKFNYFDDLGCSTYSKVYGRDPGEVNYLLLTRLWEYNHAYDTGIDNLRLYTDYGKMDPYNDKINLNSIILFTGPKINGLNKVPGYVTDIDYCKFNNFNDDNVEYFKQKIYSGYGILMGFDMYSYFLNDKSYYCPEKEGESSIWCVNIVGWDDNYSKDNFKIAPPNDGAFLIQGTGNDGLYWISYYSYCLRDYYITRYVDKSKKQFTNTKTYYKDIAYLTSQYDKKYGKVVFECDKAGTLYGLQLNTNFYYLYKPYNYSYFPHYYVNSYKIYLNDELKEEKIIDVDKYYRLYDLDTPIQYNIDDIIEIEVERKGSNQPYMETWKFDNIEDRIANGGKKQTSFFRNSINDDWELIEENLGTKYEPDIYYAQIPLSLLVDENVHPEELEFVEDEVSLNVYDKGQLEWQFTPEDTTNKNVSFESSDLSVVMVNDYGEIKGIKEGTATITITSEDGELTDTCKVTVTKAKIRVTGVTLDKNELTLIKGNTSQLSATVLPENAYNQNITWSSSNSNVATVDQDGVVSAYGVGVATITVETEETGYTATCEVTVVIPVASVTLNTTTKTIKAGESFTLTATVLPKDASDKTVTWSSSNEDVATVDNGKVKGITSGEATITVKTNDGEYTANCVVTVLVPVTGVQLDNTSATINKGETLTLKETVLPEGATDKSVTWTSSNSNVATVENGIVTGIANGKATITVKTNDGSKKATCEVTVIVPVDSVQLDKTSATIKKGESLTLKSTVLPEGATNKSVTWSTSDSKIATVSNGTVKGIANGSATITVKTNDGSKIATCEITVIVPVTSISLNKNNIKVKIDETYTLQETVLPDDATDKSVIWSSSNTTVATVTNGVVTGISAGKATITATTNDGNKIATCEVIVVTPVESVELDETEITLKKGEVKILNATVLPGDATDKTLIWSSSYKKVATVTDGKVTAVNGGNATITVKTKDGGYIATCDVTVIIPVTSVKLDKTSAVVNKGNSFSLKATVSPSNATDKSVIWYSDNDSIATVEDGVVTGVSAGTTKIYVKTNDGNKIATCSVKVKVPVTGIDVTPESVTLIKGKTTTLKATVYPTNATNRSVTWKSSNTKVATVSASGVVKGINSGKATITAKTLDGAYIAICNVTVTIPVTSVKVAPTKLTLVAGKTATLKATVYPTNASNKTVTWKTDNSNVATVNSKGVVTAIGGGKANITVITNDGKKTAVCKVTVTVPVESVELDKNILTISKGKTATLKATINPSDATVKTVSWKTSNKKVATVTSKGVVKGVKAGVAIITVTTTDGKKTDTCKVTVK